VKPKKRPLKTLERVLSKAGIGSRVEARSWIHAGRVKVNGTLIRNPDHWVDMEREPRPVRRQAARRTRAIYLLLYKPTGI
jgi:16S rRNA U516 pseudouridylate synthase RsuA-like enzyme